MAKDFFNREIHCNMLVVDNRNRVCVVKDTCDGCPHIPDECALRDLYEDTGLIENWNTVSKDLPAFRKRLAEKGDV